MGPDKALARSYFDDSAATYSARCSRGLLGWLRGREWESIERCIAPTDGEEILDAACGSGYQSQRLMALGCIVTAIDYSPQMVKIARAAGINATLGDIESVNLDRKFDKVLCAGALEFCSDPRQAIHNLARHLRGTGRLVVLFPSSSATGRLYRLYHRRHGLRIKLFEADEVADWIESEGLTVDDKGTPVPFTCVLAATRHST